MVNTGSHQPSRSVLRAAYIRDHVVNMLVLCPDTVVLMERTLSSCHELFGNAHGVAGSVQSQASRLHHAHEFVKFSVTMGEAMVSLGIVYPDWKLANIARRPVGANNESEFCLIDTEDLVLHRDVFNGGLGVRATYRPTGWQLDDCHRLWPNKGAGHICDAFVVMITAVQALLTCDVHATRSQDIFFHTRINGVSRKDTDSATSVGFPYHVAEWMTQTAREVHAAVEHVATINNRGSFQAIASKITKKVHDMMDEWVTRFAKLDLSRATHEHVRGSVFAFYEGVLKNGTSVVAALRSLQNGELRGQSTAMEDALRLPLPPSDDEDMDTDDDEWEELGQAWQDMTLGAVADAPNKTQAGTRPPASGGDDPNDTKTPTYGLFGLRAPHPHPHPQKIEKPAASARAGKATATAKATNKTQAGTRPPASGGDDAIEAAIAGVGLQLKALEPWRRAEVAVANENFRQIRKKMEGSVEGMRAAHQQWKRALGDIQNTHEKHREKLTNDLKLHRRRRQARDHNDTKMPTHGKSGRNATHPHPHPQIIAKPAASARAGKATATAKATKNAGSRGWNSDTAATMFTDALLNGVIVPHTTFVAPPLQMHDPYQEWGGATFNAQYPPLDDTTFKAEFRAHLADPSKENDTYGPIEAWDVSGVTEMDRLFVDGDGNPLDGAGTFNADIRFWQTDNVTNMAGMFAFATSFNQPIGFWHTHKVTDMTNMFHLAEAFNAGSAGLLWNTDNVTSMGGMFSYAVSFNQPIGHWNTENVTTMASMFYGALSFNQPIGDWQTRNVTSMANMFGEAHAFNKPIGGWNTAKVRDMSLILQRIRQVVLRLR